MKRIERKLQQVEKLLQLLLAPIESLADTFKEVFPEQGPEELVNVLDMKVLPMLEQEGISLA